MSLQVLYNFWNDSTRCGRYLCLALVCLFVFLEGFNLSQHFPSSAVLELYNLGMVQWVALSACLIERCAWREATPRVYVRCDKILVKGNVPCDQLPLEGFLSGRQAFERVRSKGMSRPL